MAQSILVFTRALNFHFISFYLWAFFASYTSSLKYCCNIVTSFLACSSRGHIEHVPCRGTLGVVGWSNIQNVPHSFQYSLCLSNFHHLAWLGKHGVECVPKVFFEWAQRHTRRCVLLNETSRQTSSIYYHNSFHLLGCSSLFVKARSPFMPSVRTAK